MDHIKQEIIDILEKVLKKKEVSLETPPKADMGDFAFPCFTLSKELKKSPAEIAHDLKEKVDAELSGRDDTITTKVLGPYLNFFIEQKEIIKEIISAIQDLDENYGVKDSTGQLILVEGPGPNTNKPLHLGHLRNILLCQSIFNLLKAEGNEMHMINIVNDRGVHICKSMLAYQKFGEGKTPESENRKSDHFVGDFYVKYSAEEKNHPEFEEEVKELLIKWEDEDPEIRNIWKQMNDWALSGFKETYDKLGFSIEKEYYESETYAHGKEIVLKGLEEGIFKKNDEGAIVVDLEKEGLGEKVLLRSNGTSVYITQDLYTAHKRTKDYDFNKMIYVVGNEQEYHFKVLFEVFRKLGWDFADNCYHFSYGMVELPDGKMKSREGNVVDTDELIDEVVNLAKEGITERYKDLDAAEVAKRAKVIALGAIKFFFLKFDPTRNFIFNPKESVSFEGETGPYVQYAYARICAIFRKLEEDVDITDVDCTLLDTELDKKLAVMLSQYPAILSDAGKHHKPSTIAHYVFDLASTFNEYYRDNSILKADSVEVRNARLALIDSVRTVLKSGLKVLGIDVLEQM